MALLSILVFIAVGLTYAMFRARESMLGFPSAMFWAIAGAQAYILSTATWDIYMVLGFASVGGMTIFSMLSAYGLREKRDSLGDEALEKGDGDIVNDEAVADIFEGNDEPETSARSRKIQERAARRRSRSPRRGEFDF